jgi:hypothetical protein
MLRQGFDNSFRQNLIICLLDSRYLAMNVVVVIVIIIIFVLLSIVRRSNRVINQMELFDHFLLSGEMLQKLLILLVYFFDKMTLTFSLTICFIIE